MHLLEDQRACLVDKKYSDEKNTSSEQEEDNSLKRVGNYCPSTLHSSKPTASKICDQTHPLPNVLLIKNTDQRIP